MSFSSNANKDHSSNKDDDIEIQELFLLIKRNYKIITKFTFFSLLLSIFGSICIPRTWQGELQIVLKTESNNPLSLTNLPEQLDSQIGALLKKPGAANLKTQLEILKSPSVLFPVFESEKKDRVDSGKSIDTFRFKNWLKSNLSIKLEKGTSVLNLSYRSKNKNKVIPRLNKIIEEYQSYAGKDKREDIKNGIKYLDEQIDLYTKKTISAQKDVLLFSIDNDLEAKRNIDKEDKTKTYDLSIEGQRIKASNQLRNIKELIKKFEEIKNDPNEVIYFATTLNYIDENQNESNPITNTVAKIKEIDFKYNNLKNIYLDSSLDIQQTLLERNNLINQLTLDIDSFLNSSLKFNEALIASATRDPADLIKFQELLKKAAKEDATLNQLELQRRFLALEKSKYEKPWELITKPRLLLGPVAPNRRLLVGFGLFVGIIVGIIYSTYQENSKGTIFSLKKLKELIKENLLFEAELDDLKTLNKDLALFKKAFLSSKDQISFLLVGNFDLLKLNKFKEILSTNIINKKVEFIDNIFDAKDDQEIILIMSLNLINKKDINKFKENLLLKDKKISGWINLS